MTLSAIPRRRRARFTGRESAGSAHPVVRPAHGQGFQRRLPAERDHQLGAPPHAGALTVTVGVVADLIRADVYFWGSLMAAGILGSVPVAIAYSFFVDNYVSGLTAGATKG